MNISKNMRNFSVVSSATKLLGYHRNTRPLNGFHEADSLDKIEFEISLLGVCPLPTSPPRLKGHHVPPLKPNPKII